MAMTQVFFKHSSHFCAAVITSAHGVKGHVKVKCFLEEPQQLKSYSPFCNERGEEAYTVDKVISQDKDMMILSLEGTNDRNLAEALKGEKLFVSDDKLPEPGEDTYYHKDLVGLAVVSLTGNDLGKVQAIYNFGAGDLLEIKIIQGKLELIPFTKEMVSEVAQDKGTLTLSSEGEAYLKGDVYVS